MKPYIAPLVYVAVYACGCVFVGPRMMIANECELHFSKRAKHFRIGSPSFPFWLGSEGWTISSKIKVHEK